MAVNQMIMSSVEIAKTAMHDSDVKSGAVQMDIVALNVLVDTAEAYLLVSDMIESLMRNQMITSSVEIAKTAMHDSDVKSVQMDIVALNVLVDAAEGYLLVSQRIKLKFS